MRIGFDGRFIRQGRTGNGVFSQHLVQGLARLDQRNDYTVYVLEDSRFLEQPNFKLKRMPRLHGNAYARLFLTFPAELLRARVDIFHALYNVPICTRARVVLSLVEFGWFTNPRDFPASRWFLAQLRMLMRLSIARADTIITPTEIMRGRLLQAFDISPGKVMTIPFGFDQRLLERVPEPELCQIKRKFGIDREYVLYVGDLHPRKNLGLLIDAFARLCEAGKCPHQLVLAGKDHWHAEEIRKKAAASPACKQIVFTGYVPDHELPGLYQGASLFVLPSLDEGYGLPVHEAMASGVPVLASRLPTLQEVAQNAALYFEPSDPEELSCLLERVLADETTRRDLVARGKKRIVQFTWEASCRKLLDVYEALGPSPKPRGLPVTRTRGKEQAGKLEPKEA